MTTATDHVSFQSNKDEFSVNCLYNSSSTNNKQRQMLEAITTGTLANACWCVLVAALPRWSAGWLSTRQSVAGVYGTFPAWHPRCPVGSNLRRVWVPHILLNKPGTVHWQPVLHDARTLVLLEDEDGSNSCPSSSLHPHLIINKPALLRATNRLPV